MSFDTKTEIVIQSRLAASGGLPVDVHVRFPYDEEWAGYVRSKKFVMRDLGRGANETLQPPPGEADLKLFDKIKLNGAPELTAGEAFKVIDVISMCKVQSIAIEGASATVEVQVLTGTVTHHLKVPNADQALLYKRSAIRHINLPHNQTHAVISQQVCAQIYDECGGHSDDYPNGVPMPHKHEVTLAVINEIDREWGPRTNDDVF